MSLNGVVHFIGNVDSEAWILFGVAACVSCGLCLPIMLYWCYQIYKYRHQSFVRSHHPKILFFNCGLACVCVVERVMALMHDLNILEYSTIIRNVLYIFIFGFYIHCYLLRHWLLFYDLRYREAQVNIRWEHELNLVRSHWFIDHRRNLGNARFMMCALFIFFHVGLAGLCTLYLLYGELLWRVLISICGVIVSLFFTFISYKISTIHNAKMKREAMYAGIVLLIGAFLYSLMIGVLRLAQTTMILISWFVSTLLPFVLHLMSTWYQVKSNTAPRKRSLAQQQQMNELFDRLQAKKLTLREILKNVDGFKLFLRHLIKDLCVENLIYLSYVIQFKILYSFLVQKEFDSLKTRAALVEEDESVYDPTEQKLDPPHAIAVKSSYSNHSRSAYYFDDDDEYNELYGWSMELPQVFGLQDKDKIKSTHAYTNEEELALTMYQEALNIYVRFIKVASKDEINISHKMRISLKKYFENEEVSYPHPQAKGTITLPRFTARASSSKDRSRSMNHYNARNGSLSTGGAMATRTQFPASMPAAGAKCINYSNESMNIHLTQDSNHSMDRYPDGNESIDLDSSDMVSTEMSDVVGDIDFGMQQMHSQQVSTHHKEATKKRTRTSTIGSEFGGILKKSFAARKAPKLRSVVAMQPTDNYLNLSWIQRLKIFDKSCDSIEKLLRIDSYGKFRESPEYIMYCEILCKKKMSTSGIMRQTSNIMKNAIVHARGRSSDIKGSLQVALGGGGGVTGGATANGNAALS